MLRRMNMVGYHLMEGSTRKALSKRASAVHGVDFCGGIESVRKSDFAQHETKIKAPAAFEHNIGTRGLGSPHALLAPIYIYTPSEPCNAPLCRSKRALRDFSLCAHGSCEKVHFVSSQPSLPPSPPCQATTHVSGTLQLKEKTLPVSHEHVAVLWAVKWREGGSFGEEAGGVTVRLADDASACFVPQAELEARVQRTGAKRARGEDADEQESDGEAGADEGGTGPAGPSAANHLMDALAHAASLSAFSAPPAQGCLSPDANFAAHPGWARNCLRGKRQELAAPVPARGSANHVPWFPARVRAPQQGNGEGGDGGEECEFGRQGDYGNEDEDETYEEDDERKEDDGDENDEEGGTRFDA